jgi:hypothetical protein
MVNIQRAFANTSANNSSLTLLRYVLMQQINARLFGRVCSIACTGRLKTLLHFRGVKRRNWQSFAKCAARLTLQSRLS